MADNLKWGMTPEQLKAANSARSAVDPYRQQHYGSPSTYGTIEDNYFAKSGNYNNAPKYLYSTASGQFELFQAASDARNQAQAAIAANKAAQAAGTNTAAAPSSAPSSSTQYNGPQSVATPQTGNAMAPTMATAQSGLLTQNTSAIDMSSLNINPVTRTITADELASTQLDKLLSKDSALSQRATTSGMQYANSRGLLSSSMAGEAAYGAWVDRASPFAVDDAGKYTNVLDRNMDAKNEFGLADKKFGFDLTLQGNDLAWRSGENALDRSLTVSESALNRGHDLSMQGNQFAFQGGQNALDRSHQAGMQSSAQEWQSGEAGLDRDWRSGEGALDRDASVAQQERAIQADMERLIQQSQLEIQRLGYAFNLDQYSVSQSYAATTAQNTLNAINTIQADPNLDPESKKGAIKNVIDVANENLAWASTFYNTPLPSMTTPGGTSTTIKPQPGYSRPGAATPTTTNDQYSSMVANAYKSVLGREPDAPGLNYWINEAKQNGWTQAQIEAYIRSSAQANGELK